MKKIYLILFASIIIFSLSLVLVNTVFAVNCPDTGDPSAKGIVNCGISCSCTINNFFGLLAKIYNFMVWNIASPLAVLMVTVGGVLMLISAGNPNLFGLGKKTVYAAIIGIILVFGALLIINSILGLLGIAPIG